MRRGNLFLSMLVLIWIAGPSISSASVPECASINVSPADFNPGPRPSISELERLARYRFPTVRDVADEPVSFWDFVPAEFYTALGRTKQQVESMGMVGWDLAFTDWRGLRRWDDRRFSFGTRGRIYREIDWLYTIAEQARFIEDDADVSMDGHAAGEIAIDPELADYGRILRQEPTHDTLWLMVAALYAQNRVHVDPPFSAASTRMIDRHWHEFDAEPAEVRVTQKNALRRYLCSHPDVLYLTQRAERMQQSEEPEIRSRALVELSDLDTYIASSIDDFDEFFGMITSAEHRGALRSLVPANEIDAFDRMIDTEGPAKTFLQMRQTLLDAIEIEGEHGSATRVWNRLPAHIRYVWPDRCLTQARYPTNSSPIFGTPWVLSAPCDAAPLTRQQVLEGN